jgi:hypothetical protein
VVGLLVLAACGDPSKSDGLPGDVEPVPLVGTTGQGMRMRVDVDGGGDISLRLPADCGPPDESGDPGATSLHRHPVALDPGDIDDDGSFRIEESYIEEGTDGDEEHVEVVVEGRFAADATAAGTVEASTRWWDGQASGFGAPCVTGPVDWTAAERPAPRSDVAVPVGADTELAVPAGDDLLTVLETGEVLRVDVAGEARRLDGSAPAPAPPEGAGPEVVTTAGVGLGLRDVAVVADGAWMPVPDGIARHELADGRITARVAGPLAGMAAGPDALWTVSTNGWDQTLTLQRRDPVTGTVVASAPVGAGSPVVGPDALWLPYGTLAGERLDRVDPVTLATVETFEIDVELPADGHAATGDQVWFLDWRRLTAVDVSSGNQEEIDLPTAPSALTAAREGGVWTIHEREAVARRIVDGEVVRIVDLPEGWWQVTTTDDGAVWLSGGRVDVPRVVRLDPTATATG